MKECVTEQIVGNQDDLNDMINSLRFYYNLARNKNPSEPIIVEIWSFPRKENDPNLQPLRVG